MLRLDPARCKGCRTCEMVCSFHHSDRTSFSPSISSTKIIRDNATGHIAIDLDETCDLCRGEETALCVKYCVYSARGLA